MFNGLGVMNGVLNIQFFVDEERFYAYDPGFRLQGEAPHIHINSVNDFDNRRMLINFALTGNMGIDSLEERNDYLLNGKYACTIWVLLGPGKIGNIDGLNEIKDDESVNEVIQRFYLNDIVTNDMVGNEKQVFARIYLVEDSQQLIKEKILRFQKALRITDTDGKNMIIDWMDPSRLYISTD